MVEGALQAPVKSNAGRAASGRRRPPRHSPVPPVCWPLLLLFALLQVADVVTTNYALAVPGVWEANPLMALMQAQFGAAWWLPKIAVANYLCVAALYMRWRWPMVFAVSISGLAVVGNLTHL
jgi:hypothetical protein